MIINFNKMNEIIGPGMNSGTGTMKAKIYADDNYKIIPCSLQPGGSIGMHRHETSDDINYFVWGEGKVICDGKEEIVKSGICHVCKKGSEHSIINTGLVDLIFLTIVVEK